MKNCLARFFWVNIQCGEGLPRDRAVSETSEFVLGTGGGEMRDLEVCKNTITAFLTSDLH
jgi:hypothetical protein